MIWKQQPIDLQVFSAYQIKSRSLYSQIFKSVKSFQTGICQMTQSQITRIPYDLPQLCFALIKVDSTQDFVECEITNSLAINELQWAFQWLFRSVCLPLATTCKPMSIWFIVDWYLIEIEVGRSLSERGSHIDAYVINLEV